MSGYLGSTRQGRPGYSSANDTPTGLAWLARDTTVLEMPDRGWTNLPPWGYARSRGSTVFAPAGLSGLGEVSANAQAAARALLQAIDMAVQTNSPLDYNSFQPLVENLSDADVVNFLTIDVAQQASQAIADLAAYGDDPDIFGVQPTDRMPSQRLAYARALASWVESNAISQFQLTHMGMDEAQYAAWQSAREEQRQAIEAQIAATAPSFLERVGSAVAGSPVGTGIIAAGSFFSGATGFNEQAIQDQLKNTSGPDADLVQGGLDAGSAVGGAITDAAKKILSLVPWYVWVGGVAVVGLVGWSKIKSIVR